MNSLGNLNGWWKNACQIETYWVICGDNFNGLHRKWTKDIVDFQNQELITSGQFKGDTQELENRVADLQEEVHKKITFKSHIELFTSFPEHSLPAWYKQ